MQVLIDWIEGDDGYHSQMLFQRESPENIPEGWTAKLVDKYGGEDQGSEFYAVWKFTSPTEEVYFKFDGSYASYDGADFQTYFKVKPVQKMITVYEKE